MGCVPNDSQCLDNEKPRHWSAGASTARLDVSHRERSSSQQM